MTAKNQEPMTPTSLHTGRIGEIEMLRALAVIFVLCQHAPFSLLFWRMDFYSYTGGGWTGVDLFFAISGFVIARSLLPLLAPLRSGEAFLHAALEFWIRRAWRLLPSAWFWLAAPLLLCVAFNRAQAFGTFAENWETFIAGILYMVNFHQIALGMTGKNGVAEVQWSLSLEEQFYIVFPFAAFYLRRWLILPLLCMVAIVFFVPNSIVGFQTRIWPAGFGVLIAIWQAHPTYAAVEPTGLAISRVARAIALWLLLACLISLATPAVMIVHLFYGPIATISGILVWIASYDRGYLCRPGHLRRVMEALGARSYSIYLVHLAVFDGMHEVWFRLYGLQQPGTAGTLLYAAAGVVLVLLVAELNHRLLEMPLRDYGRHAANRFATRRLPAGSASPV